MTKWLEESRRRWNHDPRGAKPAPAVSESPTPLDVQDEAAWTPPALTLVGGTDITPGLGPVASQDPK
jgi:hypothetical protein